MRNANLTINLAEKFSQFDECWSPRIVGELNGQYVKLAKFQGEFVWHQHDHEDELFLVVAGQIRIELEGRELRLGPGELAVIPKGTRHRPVCDEVAQVLMLEPKSTINTGNLTNDRTREPEWL
jgi:mannose-6-phosphate isomerase-like protein (cupin superfamily)